MVLTILKVNWTPPGYVDSTSISSIIPSLGLNSSAIRKSSRLENSSRGKGQCFFARAIKAATAQLLVAMKASTACLALALKVRFANESRVFDRYIYIYIRSARTGSQESHALTQHGELFVFECCLITRSV